MQVFPCNTLNYFGSHFVQFVAVVPLLRHKDEQAIK